MEWFNKLDIKLQVVIISSITSVFVFLIGWILKVFYERSSLNYKLKKEFEFEQRKKLKEDIAKNKIPLINIIEELNDRLWNLNENIEKGWLKIEKKDWEETQKYYTRSFVYRFLVFIHWTLKTECDTMAIDTTVADSDDILYLKYIKTFKNIFSEPKLLSELNYSNGHDTNHFFKNDLKGYTKLVLDLGSVIDFDDFCKQTRDKFFELEKVIRYFSEIENNNSDKNLNILRCFHLLSISFLNKYGHTYQHLEESRLDELTSFYKTRILIKNGFGEFIKKSKLEKEMKSILGKIK